MPNYGQIINYLKSQLQKNAERLIRRDGYKFTKVEINRIGRYEDGEIAIYHYIHFKKKEFIGYGHDYDSYALRWMEYPIGSYMKKAPPTELLKKIKRAQDLKIFDEIRIAEVTCEVADPLLIGRIKDSDKRYCFGQWDGDILLDDII